MSNAKPPAQTAPSDVCLILEGSYPFVRGGVSSWTHALIEAAPHLSFSIVALTSTSRPLTPAYTLPENVTGLTQVALESFRMGPAAPARKARAVEEFGNHVVALIRQGGLAQLQTLHRLLDLTGFGQRALLDSRTAWNAMTAAYEELLPSSPLVEFFWTWRVLARSYGALLTAPLPKAKVYHAISTGYAGLYGARARLTTGRPLVITEHGIYTNERRIEIALAQWLFCSGRSGFSTADGFHELRDLWQGAFSSMALTAYAASDLITTLYAGNQAFQIADGAERAKLRIIPNGVDYAGFAALQRDPTPHRPTVALIGRVVPIKDIRTFIFACSALRRRVSEFEALIMGPMDEDPAYAAECRALVAREGLENHVRFVGQVNVKEWLGRVDVAVLTSISEAQPLVLLESGAAGIPSVTTDVGSCREMIEGIGDTITPGDGGIVVRVGDSTGIAEALAQLLTDHNLRARMGAVIRKRVERAYNKVEIDRIYNGMYADLIARPTALAPIGRAIA